ncbi:MAG: mannose-1-phosphate guanylyltransferase [Rhabdochlamydiaceae bacterium]
MKVLILAGGSGTRLWPTSREASPKQFLKLGGESFFQKTLRRFLRLVSKEDIWAVTHQKYGAIIQEQIGEIDPSLTSQIILEPERKNTAPAIALALKFLEEKKECMNEIVLVASSDHFIADEKRFLEKVAVAEGLAKQGKLVMLGVLPNKPETGYGYIKINQTTGAVEAFVEKPSEERAGAFIQDGSYLWNCGIFMCRIETFWQELRLHYPTLAYFSYQEILDAFPSLPPISIDYALMEKTKNGIAVVLDLAWSDIGSWDSIFDVSEKDGNCNVKIGNVLDIDTKNSLILGGKKLISTVGLEDMVIVETDDILFIGKRGESQKVKMIVEELKKQQRDQDL